MSRRNSTPLGVKLNNPLNIRYSERNQWLGLCPRKPQEKGFCRFQDLDHGYRAALVLMLTYMRKYNLLTPAAIIYRWAPPTENKTHLYLAAICAYSGLDQNDIIEELSIEMLELIVAMARIETGLRPDVTYLMDLCGKFGLI